MTPDQQAAFQSLMKQWKVAFNEMRAAERVCQQAVARHQLGQGIGATPEQIAAAEKASELEAKLSKELNQLWLEAKLSKELNQLGDMKAGAST